MFFYSGHSTDRLLVFDYAPIEKEWAIKAEHLKRMAKLVHMVCGADMAVIGRSKAPKANKFMQADFMKEIEDAVFPHKTVVFSGATTAKKILKTDTLSGREFIVETSISPFTLTENVQKIVGNSTKIKITSVRSKKGFKRVKIIGFNRDMELDETKEILEELNGIGIVNEESIKDKIIQKSFFSKSSDGMYTVTELNGIRYGYTEQPTFFYKRFFTEMFSIIKRDIEFVEQAVPIDSLEINAEEVCGSLSSLQDKLVLTKKNGDLLPIGLDIESTGLRPWEYWDKSNRVSDDLFGRQLYSLMDKAHCPHSIISVSVSTDEKKGYSFNVEHPRFAKDNTHDGLGMLRWVAGLPNPKVIHNLKFEYTWICEHYGIIMNGTLTDTMVQEHLLHEGMFSGTNRLALKGVTAMRLKLIPHKDDFLPAVMTGLKATPLGSAIDTTFETLERLKQHSMSYIVPIRKMDFSLMKRANLHKYGGIDAVLPLRLLRSQMAEFQERRMALAWKWLATDLVSRQSILLAKMEYRGFPLDSDRCMETVRRCDTIAATAGKELIKLFGDIKFNSSKELEKAFDEKFPGLSEDLPRTAQGDLSITEDILKLRGDEHPWLYHIFEFRHAHKVRGTYMIPFMQYASVGRTHFNFHIAGPATGRLSSYQPNMQNIPEIVKGIPVKDCLKPEEGQIIINVDLKNAEIRMLANMSQDATLIKILNEGLDLHAFVAAEIYKVPYEDLMAAKDKKGDLTEQDHTYRKYRSNAKPVNFGIAYGISGSGLAAQIGCTEAEGDKMIAAFFRAYPGVKRFLDQVEKDAFKQGYAETFTGRRRFFPLLKSQYRRYVPNFIVQQMLRKLKNFTIQSPTSDLFQYMMYDMINIPGLTPHITVHDSIVFSFDYKNHSILDLYNSLHEIIVVNPDSLWPGLFKVKMGFDIEIGPDYGNHLVLKYKDIVALSESKEDLLEYYNRKS